MPTTDQAAVVLKSRTAVRAVIPDDHSSPRGSAVAAATIQAEAEVTHRDTAHTSYAETASAGAGSDSCLSRPVEALPIPAPFASRSSSAATPQSRRQVSLRSSPDACRPAENSFVLFHSAR